MRHGPVRPWLRRTMLLLVTLALLLPLAAASANQSPIMAGVSAHTNVNLRIRSGPGTGYAAIDVAPRGATLPVLGRTENGSWIYVQHDGSQGWTAAWLTSLTGDLNAVPVGSGSATRVAAAAPTTQHTGVTAAPRVNLRMRSGPGTGNRVVGSVPAGSAVPVMGRSADSRWVQVDYNGQRGWLAAWYMTVNGDLNSVPVGGSAGAPQPAPQAPAAPQGEAAEVLHRLNQVRCQQGMQPVVQNAQLSAAAMAHTQDMVSNNFFSHTGSNGSTLVDRVRAQGYPFVYVGENLAAGNSVAGPTFDQWMNSPGHRDNMLNPTFSEAGLAHIYQPGTTYGHYWALVLGARRGFTPPTCAQLGY